jgi:hypothetical protein
MNPRTAIFAICASTALFASGCATYKAGAVSERDVKEYTNMSTITGVTVAAELLSKPEKIEEGFYVNLAEKDFYPVQIVAQNGTDARMLLTKDSIVVSDAAGNVYRPVNVTVMTDEFEHNKIAYALLGFGIFSYMSAEDANKKMAADWSSKEMAQEVILNPSRRNAGFVYLKMPKGVKPEGMTLEVKVENLETKASQSFKLRL